MAASTEIRDSTDTIAALSTGALPSGVAVIRLSGPGAFDACRVLTGSIPERNQYLVRCRFMDPANGETIDSGMKCRFTAPSSFTGEDVVEFHLHGSTAVVSRVLDLLVGECGCRIAEAGEFSRRAFENGKMDLTAIEGLADLLAAETEAQRRLAVRQAEGELAGRIENWRSGLIRCRAMLEAEFDFADEEDVPDTMIGQVMQHANGIAGEISSVLAGEAQGEIVRRGYRVALVGPPNAGKSSLLNALAKRDIAIVTEVPGTTRDLVEARIDLDGMAVILTDTAGIRESGDKVEAIGIARAREAAAAADAVVWLSPLDAPALPEAGLRVDGVFISKADLVPDTGPEHAEIDSEGRITVKYEEGLEPFLSWLRGRLRGATAGGEPLICRKRQAGELRMVAHHLERFRSAAGVDRVMAAEELRLAGDALGRLTGRIDVEDLLDVIFAEFCVGK